MAGRAILSVDQAALTRQGFLQYHGKCSEVADLERRVGVVLVTILCKRLKLSRSRYEILQILSLNQ